MYPGTSLRLAWGSSGRWHVIEQQQQEQAARQLCDQATRRRRAGQIIRSDSTRELRRVDGQRPVRLGVTSRPSKPAGQATGGVDERQVHLPAQAPSTYVHDFASFRPLPLPLLFSPTARSTSSLRTTSITHPHTPPITTSTPATMIVDPVQALASVPLAKTSATPLPTVVPSLPEYQTASETGERTLW